MNIDRLGPLTTLILIDHVQQLVQSGVIFNLYKTPQIKQYLIQFMEHIQTGRFVGVYLQRLIEQMNVTKKPLFLNQLNALIQQTRLMSNNKTTVLKYTYDELISILMNLANKGQLNTYSSVITSRNLVLESLTNLYQNIEMDDDNLQSIINFLHEQSSIALPPGPIPYQYITDFVQNLRHFAQLGILYEPPISTILTDLHKAKDQNHITLESFKIILEHLNDVHYVNAYRHLNLMEFEKFLNDMTSEGEYSYRIILNLLNCISFRLFNT